MKVFKRERRIRIRQNDFRHKRRIYKWMRVWVGLDGFLYRGQTAVGHVIEARWGNLDFWFWSTYKEK